MPKRRLTTVTVDTPSKRTRTSPRHTSSSEPKITKRTTSKSPSRKLVKRETSKSPARKTNKRTASADADTSPSRKQKSTSKKTSSPSPSRKTSRQSSVKKEKEIATPTKTKKRQHIKIELEQENIPAQPVDPNAPPVGRASWHAAHQAIIDMRSTMVAPVDTMGCAELGNRDGNPRDHRFQILISLMLSSQTKDPITAAAMGRLMSTWPDGLTVANVRATKVEKLKEIIYGVGFHNRKAEYLKKTAEILHSDYADDIPPTVQEMCALPGIGPKMAYLAMQEAWKNNVGIGVDVHVHRITNRLGWIKTKNPEQTRAALEEWLPKELWGTINKLLVGFGQTVCFARNPQCHTCKASPYCQYGQKNLRIPKKQIKAKVTKTKTSETTTASPRKGRAIKTETDTEAETKTDTDTNIKTETEVAEIEPVIIKPEDAPDATDDTKVKMEIDVESKEITDTNIIPSSTSPSSLSTFFDTYAHPSTSKSNNLSSWKRVKSSATKLADSIPSASSRRRTRTSAT